MSMADQIFINMCKDILENGTSTEGEKYALTGRTVLQRIRLSASAWLTGMTFRRNFR